MNKTSKVSLTTTKKNVKPTVVKKTKQGKSAASLVLDTSGGRLPDPSEHTSITEAEVRNVFGKNKSTTK
jgi:hypothetical protein